MSFVFKKHGKFNTLFDYVNHEKDITHTDVRKGLEAKADFSGFLILGSVGY